MCTVTVSSLFLLFNNGNNISHSNNKTAYMVPLYYSQRVVIPN